MSAPPTTTTGLAPAARLLTLLARLELSPKDIEEGWALVADAEFDSAAFVDLAARHDLAYLIGRHVLRYGLHVPREGIAFPHDSLFATAYAGNRARNRLLYDECGRILEALNRTGIQFAVRKGPVLIERHFTDPGVRYLFDIDVLIDRADASRTGAVLRSAGYVQGRLNQDGDRIEEFSRATHMFWRVNLNNQLPYKKLGRCAEVPFFQVDICTGIFQPKSGADASVPELLSRGEVIQICGAQAIALSPQDEFVDLCTHLHKEATSRHYLETGHDLSLRKFLDVATVATSLDAVGWQRAMNAAREYRAERFVYYALHHTDLLYPGVVPGDVMAGLRPADLDYLDEYGDSDGTIVRWQRPFLERLFDSARHHGVPRSVIPTH